MIKRGAGETMGSIAVSEFSVNKFCMSRGKINTK